MADDSFFDSVDPKVSFPSLEEETLSYWKKNKIFEKSVNERESGPSWTFLDGPPFITGLPHYGTLLSSIPKDIFPRYKTMKGFKVRRVWGWDCHGLPAENKVEKKLGIKRKADIEGIVGVKKFIDECKNYVSEVSGEWEWYVEHVGRWVDFTNAYKTMDAPYMESVMWVFSEMYKKGFIYKGLRVSLFCPHCETPISNFEVAMDADNYKELTEPATTYKFKVVGESDTYLLAWSTTPWNKIVTTALAVNPKLDYVMVDEGGEKLILAKSTLTALKTKKPKVLKTYKGSDLVGMKFEPYFDYFKIDEGKKAFEVFAGDFVTADEGTGIVTIAPYGEDDLTLLTRENVHIELHVGDDGKLKSEVPNWGGMDYLEVNPLVDEYLDGKGLIYDRRDNTHTIPTCWRCATRLFFNPQDAWFVDIQKLKPQLKKNAKHVSWFPSHFKEGRFAKSMDSAPDWCISRTRYWGSPVPVWECSCGERYIPSSIAELEKLSGTKVTELHKPEIDEVTIKCTKCGSDARRVSEVLDSWIEAGSASYAEHHYPFNDSVSLEDFSPPDFIVEYTGQIRAWFYVLHVIATALSLHKDDKNNILAKNVSVTGVVLGTDGRKMSKNFGNYPDPKEMIQKYGGDALRLYLMGSPVMHGEDVRISEEEYRNQIKEFMLIYWNIYNFFVTYATLDGWKPGEAKASHNILDKWILSRLSGVVADMEESYEAFDTPQIIKLARDFAVSDLSSWYLRRSRERMGPGAEDGEDKTSAYQTLWNVLVTFSKALAPIAPFVTEVVYRNLTKDESIHLTDWPKDLPKRDMVLESEMATARQVVERGHSLRKVEGIAVRQALNGLATNLEGPVSYPEITEVIQNELNVLSVSYGVKEDALDKTETPELIEMTKVRGLARSIQEERKNMGMDLSQKVVVYNNWVPEDEKQLKWILRKTMTSEIKKGEFKVVSE